MGTLDRRVARLEAAIAGPARVHVITIGVNGDEDAAVARLLPDARPTDTVVIVRRFADPDAPVQLARGGS
jgi:hypothetical protein